MLAKTHSFTRRLCIALAIAVSLVFITTTPALAGDTWADGGGDTGSIGITNPGSGGGSSGGGTNNDLDGVTDVNYSPGPSTCVLEKGTPTGGASGPGSKKQKKDKEIDCSSSSGSWWDNDQQCYWVLSSQTGTATNGAAEGSWYECVPYGCEANSGDPMCWSTPVFMASPPAGVTKISPHQAATQAAAQLQIQPITVGMAPKHNPDLGYRRSHVGVPIWMWVEDPTRETWGPWDISVTLGGQTITATATATSVEWNMGDGTTVVCEQGQAYNTAYGFEHSPSCGHSYNQTGTYTVTATTQWRFDWSGGGQSGTIDLSTSTTEEVTINEVQSVNVSPDGP